MAPSDPAVMSATVEASPRFAKYAESIDRESARNQAEEDAAPKGKAPSKPAPRRTEKKDDGGVISDVVRSSAVKDVMRTAAREIVRGAFKTGRR